MKVDSVEPIEEEPEVVNGSEVEDSLSVIEENGREEEDGSKYLEPSTLLCNTQQPPILQDNVNVSPARSPFHRSSSKKKKKPTFTINEVMQEVCHKRGVDPSKKKLERLDYNEEPWSERSHYKHHEEKKHAKLLSTSAVNIKN